MTYNTPAAAKSPRTHTVYQIPRSVTWHVERRLPAAVAEALASKIAGLQELFQTAGCDFRTIVALDFSSGQREPKISLDFRGVDIAQIQSLGRTLSETFGDEYVGSILDRSTLSRTAATRAVTSMLSDHLRLSTTTHDELEAALTAEVRAKFPTSTGHQPSRRDAEFFAQLETADGPLPLAGPTDMHQIDELIAAVHAQAPWLNRPLMRIWSLMKMSLGTGTLMPPILLWGPGGTGKSVLARLIAEAAQLPALELDASAGAAAFRIAGVEAGWSTARLGEPLRFIATHRCPNPMIIVNELDKATSGARVASGGSTSLINALLPLLDRQSATHFRCPASGLVCDMSQISWALTANEISGLSQPFLSRIEVIHVPALDERQFVQALHLMCPDDDAVRDAVRKFIAEDWHRPEFSLRLLARVIARLRSENEELVH
jgi:ATP-dependent Lon protease